MEGEGEVEEAEEEEDVEEEEEEGETKDFKREASTICAASRTTVFNGRVYNRNREKEMKYIEYHSLQHNEMQEKIKETPLT